MELTTDKRGDLKVPAVGRPGERWEWRIAGEGMMLLVRSGELHASYLTPPPLTATEARQLFARDPQAEARELRQALASSQQVAKLCLPVEEL